jgi:hypothetical protein
VRSTVAIDSALVAQTERAIKKTRALASNVLQTREPTAQTAPLQALSRGTLGDDERHITDYPERLL